MNLIPKPVAIKETGGFFKAKEIPEIETNTVKMENDEGYKLIIKEDKIIIEAGTPAGVHNGRETFRQLALSEFKDASLQGSSLHGSGFVLPCAEITDYPQFSWRGFMLDCSRYFYSVEFIKKILDVLSLHHINRFHWHLTDDQGWRLPVKEYPLLTQIGSRRLDRRYPETTYVGGFYTEEEIHDVVNFAASRHIEVIPEVDLPGHTSSVLAAYPGLGCTGGPYRVEDRFGIFEDVLCAGNDQIFDLIAAIFDALVALFPSKWAHIGGDEVMFNRWEECPKCQKKVSEFGLEKTSELQSYITQKMAQMLAQRGKTAVGWDEILDASKKFPLPKEAVVMSWQGAEGGIKAANLGHRVIMTPNTEGCYVDYKHIDNPEEPGQTFNSISSVYQTYSMNPVTNEMKNKNLILGAQCNLWSELIYAGKIAEYMIFPRICALAENLWTPKENKDFEDFAKRLEVHRIRLDKLGINQYRGPLR